MCFFFIQGHTVRKNVFLAISDTSSRSQLKHIFRIYKPNSGLQAKCETLTSLKEKASKVLPDEVEEEWKVIYDKSELICNHMLWYGACKKVSAGSTCDIGLRKRTYSILSGAVSSIYPDLEKSVPHMSTRVQIVRFKTDEGLRVIGKLVTISYTI